MQKQPLVLYFYPKDFTPGCTKEACEFRDSFEVFRDLDVAVFGISGDSIEQHQKFKAKHKLPFHLLADEGLGVAKQYKATIPLLNMPKRTTYLIDGEQQIVAVYEPLFNAKQHIVKMIEQLKTQWFPSLEKAK